MLIRFTKNAQESIQDLQLTNNQAENRYCEWLCDMCNINYKPFFVILNAYSFYGTVIPAEDITTLSGLVKAFTEALKTHMEKDGLLSIYENDIAPHLADVSAANTYNRSSTAKMNGIKRNYGPFYDRHPNFFNNYTLNDNANPGNSFKPKQFMASQRMQEPVDEAPVLSTKRKPFKSPEEKRYLSPMEMFDLSERLFYEAAEAQTPESALEFYNEIITMYETFFGKAYFEKNKGDFWLILDTRPYMRAMFGKGQIYFEMGQSAAAAEIFAYMLELCPGDNVGARHYLAHCYIDLKQYDKAEELYSHYEDYFCDMLWSRVLYLIAADAPDAELKQAVKEANESNKFVVRFLADDAADFPEPLEYTICGGEDEAYMYAAQFKRVWEKVPNAIPYIKTLARKRQ